MHELGLKLEIWRGHQVWQRGIAYANGTSDVERLVDIDSDPIVRGDVVYLASYQGYIGALSMLQGQFIWNKPASIYKNMVIDQHALYAVDDHDVVWAYDLKDGHVLWKQVHIFTIQQLETKKDFLELFVFRQMTEKK